eukprot:m.418014 g.418014  ORF g.418014 m.418014 type:complete len:81 (+) comp16834_c0_seq62:4084-4326(+)
MHQWTIYKSSVSSRTAAAAALAWRQCLPPATVEIAPKQMSQSSCNQSPTSSNGISSCRTPKWKSAVFLGFSFPLSWELTR